MSAIGLIVHERRDEAATQAAELARWLSDSGHEVRVSSIEGTHEGLEAFVVPDGSFGEGLDVAVSLGGDGSMLRAVQLVGTSSAPILGVDFGQLGYLTAVQPDQTRAAVEKVLRGDCEVEERMLIDVTVSTGGAIRRERALNEAVLERTGEANTIRIAVSIDDRFFTTYAADGLIVATPTGSTAYAFSARGPIVAPTHRAFQLTPVSPHMLFDRTLVLEPERILRLTMIGSRSGALSVDGNTIAVMDCDDWIECTASNEVARLVRFDDDHFHSVLKAKFGLNDR
ncbi:MAG: NAD(+)/NADH kinase [Acidobacteria bacterium]|nr:NAD(+)/NADH kinase [Acidobacteriota bacterium]